MGTCPSAHNGVGWPLTSVVIEGFSDNVKVGRLGMAWEDVSCTVEHTMVDVEGTGRAGVHTECVP